MASLGHGAARVSAILVPGLKRTLSLLSPAAAAAQPSRVPDASTLASTLGSGGVAAPCYKAVLIDAAGTLVSPSEPIADVYLRYGRPYGVQLGPDEVLARFRRAYNTPWGGSPQRYVGDGRPFWRWIVAQSTGCDNEAMFEEIFRYYETPEAWHLAPGAMVALSRLRAAGVRLAVVSNFDTRLRPLLQALGVAPLFDTLVVSAEVGFEKPCPAIFEAALVQLGDGLRCDEVLHVGDDRRNDVWGARDAGMHSLLWGVDVASFDELADRVLLGTVE